MAFDERNDSAFEWAHNALVDFCVEGTDEDEDEVEVKTCLQAIYCFTGDRIEDRNYIFDKLEDRDDIVGSVDKRKCSYSKLTGDKDELEDLFDR